MVLYNGRVPHLYLPAYFSGTHRRRLFTQRSIREVLQNRDSFLTFLQYTVLV
jgi:hypothetical protein